MKKMIINGQIMPLRESGVGGSADKRCVRGEDIAFLLEACAERQAAVGGTSPSGDLSFSRRIRAAQVNSIAQTIRNMYDSGKYVKYINGSNLHGLSSAVQASDLVSYYSLSDCNLSETEFKSGDPLKLSKIENLFDQLKPLDCFKISLAPVRFDFARYTYTTSGAEHERTWDDDYLKSNRIIYYHTVKRDWSGTVYWERYPNTAYEETYVAKMVQVDNDKSRLQYEGAVSATSGMYGRVFVPFTVLYTAADGSTIDGEYGGFWSNAYLFPEAAAAYFSSLQSPSFYIPGGSIHSAPAQSSETGPSANQTIQVSVSDAICFCKLRDRTIWY